MRQYQPCRACRRVAVRALDAARDQWRGDLVRVRRAIRDFRGPIVGPPLRQQPYGPGWKQQKVYKRDEVAEWGHGARCGTHYTADATSFDTHLLHGLFSHTCMPVHMQRVKGRSWRIARLNWGSELAQQAGQSITDTTAPALSHASLLRLRQAGMRRTSARRAQRPVLGRLQAAAPPAGAAR